MSSSDYQTISLAIVVMAAWDFRAASNGQVYCAITSQSIQNPTKLGKLQVFLYLFL